MAKTKTAKEIRQQNTEDLEKELEGLVEGLFKLRFRKVTDVVENPAEFKKSRRHIARIKTVLRERELKR